MALFKNKVISLVNVIECPQYMDKNALTDFVKIAAEWSKLPVKLHILDFKDVEHIHVSFYRPMGAFRQSVNDKGNSLFSIHIRDTILDQFRSEGTEGIFSPITSVKEALEKSGLLQNSPSAPPQSNSITVEFLAPFVSAVLNTIKMMANTKVLAGKPKADNEKAKLNIDIGSTIVMENAQVQGCVGLYFSEIVIKTLYLKITKKTEFQMGPDALDLVKELMNISFGRAKTDWNNLGYSFKRDLPQGLMNEKLEAHKKEFLPEAVVLPFETPDGTFYMGITLTKIGSQKPLPFGEK